MAAMKHTCGGPVFGHKTVGCPRCDELLAGAAPIAQGWRKAPAKTSGIAAHLASAAHRTCGPVCVYGDF